MGSIGLLLVKGRSRCKGYVEGSAWLEMRQARDIWLITLNQGVDIRLNMASKTHEMQLQLDIYKGVPMGKIQHKFQEEYEFLGQGHGETKKGLPQPKGGNSVWAPNAKKDLTRAPMYRKALPFTQYHF